MDMDAVYKKFEIFGRENGRLDFGKYVATEGRYPVIILKFKDIAAEILKSADTGVIRWEEAKRVLGRCANKMIRLCNNYHNNRTNRTTTQK